jgi:hypothetical protein
MTLLPCRDGPDKFLPWYTLIKERGPKYKDACGPFKANGIFEPIQIYLRFIPHHRILLGHLDL